MIVVDTSVWIDFFRGVDRPHVTALVDLVELDTEIAITDVVLAELLQGTADDRDAARVEGRLAPHALLELHGAGDARRAASMYRKARAAGHTIRRTLDCLIAAVCVREDAAILHADVDFDRLAMVTELRVYQPWSIP